MDRVYNVEKSRKRVASRGDEPSEKRARGRPKKIINLSRYPSIRKDVNCDDDVQQQQLEAIAKEMEKSSPRKEILLPLMKETFYSRRKYILDCNDSVFTKLGKYPGLRIPPVVSYSINTPEPFTVDPR